MVYQYHGQKSLRKFDRLLRESWEAQKQRMVNLATEKSPREPLSRSTAEFYLSAFLAVVTLVFPLTWWLKLILALSVFAMAFDVINRHRKTVNLPTPKKIAVGVPVFFLIGIIFYFPVRKQYEEDHKDKGFVYLDIVSTMEVDEYGRSVGVQLIAMGVGENPINNASYEVTGGGIYTEIGPQPAVPPEMLMGRQWIGTVIPGADSYLSQRLRTPEHGGIYDFRIYSSNGFVDEELSVEKTLMDGYPVFMFGERIGRLSWFPKIRARSQP